MKKTKKTRNSSQCLVRRKAHEMLARQRSHWLLRTPAAPSGHPPPHHNQSNHSQCNYYKNAFYEITRTLPMELILQPSVGYKCRFINTVQFNIESANSPQSFPPTWPVRDTLHGIPAVWPESTFNQTTTTTTEASSSSQSKVL